MVNRKLLPKLLEDLHRILDDDDYYDIKIEVGNDPNVRIFRAHMIILNYRSPYFQRILSRNKDDGTITQIKLPNVLPDIFQIILGYIYEGELDLKEYSVSDTIKILVTASELDLQELISYSQPYLIKNKRGLMEQNFSLIYKASIDHSFLELQKFCEDLISEKPEKIFNSPDFISISEKILISLIQNDKLKMSRVQVWEHVLKWGIAQNPELPSDHKNFSKEDFSSLKNNLTQFIPFIRFHDLSSREFLYYVFPYKEVLPGGLYDDLIKLFLNHDYIPSERSTPKQAKEPTSKESEDATKESTSAKHQKSREVKDIDSIITPQHAELISKWIHKTKSHEFKLIFRGSRDGFTAGKFHEICDNKPRTVTVIKVKGSDEILGGYNPITWKSTCSYGITKDSFIFSFSNKETTTNTFSRVMDGNFAINCWEKFGPSFGRSDLILQGTNFCGSQCKQRTYISPIRKTKENFSVEDYEIFQVKDR